MKRPAWVTVVGVLGIIFGCFGILASGQEIMMPKIMEMQKELFSTIQDHASKQATKKDADSAQNQVMPTEMLKLMEKMWDVPEWYSTFSVGAGIVRAITSALYLLSAIFLLLMKPTAVRLFYIAAGSSIALCVVKAVVVATSMSFMGMAMMMSGIFGCLIDVVLIVVVAVSDKTAFQSNDIPLASDAV